MDFDVYCDESRLDILSSKKSSDSYMVIGSLWIPSERRNEVKDRLKQAQNEHRYLCEFKWNKVTSSKMEFYLELIDIFFEYNEDFRFRCIVVDKDKVDLFKYHQSDAELGFYKFYYQLLHHWILDCNTYSIYVDMKTNRCGNRLPILKGCLQNASLFSDIKSVQALPSHEVLFIQWADLFVGAVSAKYNGGIKSDAKKKVIGRIEEKLGFAIMPTSRDFSKFNIFKINPGGGW